MMLQYILLLIILNQVAGDNSLKHRIVGGYRIARESVPYQVSLRKSSQHFCGGVIYDRKHILTAAHCVINEKPSKLQVVVGDDNIKQVNAHTVIKQVQYNFWHEEYDKKAFANDIAVLRLKDSLDFTAQIRGVALWNMTKVPTNLCVVSGWGSARTGGKPSEYLQAVNIPLFNYDYCKNMYQSNFYRGMMCAGAPNRDSCEGDSGGPLVCDEKLVGIVSWGIKCGHPIYLGVYTNVTEYLTWIHNQTVRSSSAQVKSNNFLLYLIVFLIIQYKLNGIIR